MKFLLIDLIEAHNSNLEHLKDTDLTPQGISNEKFEEIAREQRNGWVIKDTDEFMSRFNSGYINTSTHQLRILEDK